MARKKKLSSFNVIVGKLLKSAALQEASQVVIKETFARAATLAGQVNRREITMARAIADLTSGAVVLVGRESLKALPRVLLGGSHAPIQHGRSQGGRTYTRRGQRR